MSQSPYHNGTHDPKIQATRNTSYLTASKSLNGRKIARMAPILTIFGPNRSQRRNLFFEKFSNERRRHRGIVVVVIVAVVVAVVAVVGGFSVAYIKGTSLLVLQQRTWHARSCDWCKSNQATAMQSCLQPRYRQKRPRGSRST